MRKKTVLVLNRLNRDFYQEIGGEFSRTRQRPWEGWKRLLEVVNKQSAGLKKISVLDVGCGNGRFGKYLVNNFQREISYLGIDSSRLLTNKARKNTENNEGFEIARCDFVEDGIEKCVTNRKFDLIVLFGVIHHVPGYETRLKLLEKLSQRLIPGGLMAISLWQFGGFEKFKGKILPWEVVIEKGGEVDLSDLEDNDLLLSWGQGEKVWRYCHFITKKETRRLIDELELEVVSDYLADGKSGKLNRYLLFRG